MKNVGKNFIVELNEAEICEIATALHEHYLKHREDGKNCKIVRDLQMLRNDFAQLINKQYLGFDA